MMPFTLIVISILFNILQTLGQECRSYNRQTGNCVSIQRCPPLVYVLKNNPSPIQLRHLQRLTCGFDNGNPKICCPLGVIKSKADEPAEKELELPKVSSDSDLTSHPAFNHLPTIKECGTALGDHRIIGGKNVSLGTFPWMARIGYQSGPGSSEIDYYCGGTIIGKRWILTAGKIVTLPVVLEDDPGGQRVQVRLGEHDTETIEDCDSELDLCSKAENYKIHRLIPHSEYSSNTKQNDISIILLDRDITFDKYFIRPICLPFIQEYALHNLVTGQLKGIVAGWGRTQWNKAKGSKILQQVSVPLKTNQECQMVYNRRVTISANQMCAGGATGEDSCGGDSGGPLMVALPVHKVARFFQLGVVSYGPVQCGIGGLPGVYARTTSYLKWILDKINQN